MDVYTVERSLALPALIPHTRDAEHNLIAMLRDRVRPIDDRRSTPATIVNPSQDNGYGQVVAGHCYDEHASTQYAVGSGELIGPCNAPPQKRISPQDVMDGIEHIMLDICGFLTTGELPILSNGTMRKQFTLSQARSFTSIVMVYSFVHSLLGSNRTTTTREVYYFYVTHFSSQRECDAAILDAANLLGVPRVSMGLYASPKGEQNYIMIFLMCDSYLTRMSIHYNCRLVLWMH
jgi:hypothetical protein